MKKTLLPAALTGFLGANQLLCGADLEVSVEIPRMNVAEYHRPYVAMWIERPADQSVAANLAVWYDQQTTKAEKGTTWLKDLRLWWRKSGRELNMPVDGVSGATRPPGAHQIVFRGAKAPLATLAAGSYQLVIEAAREVGGREMLRIPFQWNGTAQSPQSAQGQNELGRVQLTVKP
jgi:hypothetical protein